MAEAADPQLESTSATQTASQGPNSSTAGGGSGTAPGSCQASEACSPLAQALAPPGCPGRPGLRSIFAYSHCPDGTQHDFDRRCLCERARHLRGAAGRRPGAQSAGRRQYAREDGKHPGAARQGTVPGHARDQAGRGQGGRSRPGSRPRQRSKPGSPGPGRSVSARARDRRGQNDDRQPASQRGHTQ